MGSATGSTTRIRASTSAPPTSIPEPVEDEAARGTLRLIANHRYFGIDSRVLRTGAERAWARVARTPDKAWLDARSVAGDFHLDEEASLALLEAFAAAELVEPLAAGRYRPTARFREYARATVVAPLSRVRAKVLIHRSCRLIERMNAEWSRNPYLIDMVAVSGSYMTRRRELTELTLWLVLRRRSKTRRWTRPLDKREALRQLVSTVKAQSSFIVVRVVGDRDAIERPFSVVFKVTDDTPDTTSHTWQRLRGWSASISRRLAR